MFTKTKTTPETRKQIRNMLKPLITLKLHKFVVDAPLADFHVCGSGTDQRFTAEMELVAQDLDGKGFVTDNAGFIDQVKVAYGRVMHVASCEQLAEGLVFLAHREMGPRLARATARVFNETGSVDVVWERGQVIPPWPAVATREQIEAVNTRQSGGSKPYNC